jgi:hypothetical protein
LSSRGTERDLKLKRGWREIGLGVGWRWPAA